MRTRDNNFSYFVDPEERAHYEEDISPFYRYAGYEGFPFIPGCQTFISVQELNFSRSSKNLYQKTIEIDNLISLEDRKRELIVKTPIHTSKKLEKLIKKFISKSEWDQMEIGVLGKWHANVFFVDRKKCWLVTNAMTRYSVILANISAEDLNNIEEIFKDNLYSQIIYDGIFSDYTGLNQLLGDIEFFPTDNDRSTIGVQNNHFEELEFRKYEYGVLENMPIKKITHNLNTTPFYRGKPSTSNLTDPITEMKKMMTL